MHLIIVRHGQSTGNITTDDVPDGELTDIGQLQAIETAERLKDTGITHVVSSPLVRALATGTAIADAAAIATVEIWPELQEHRGPLHRGFGRDDLLRRFSKAVFPESFEASGWDHGGETYESALDRGIAAIAALRERHHAGDCVVVATHGGFANYLLRALLHIPARHPIWFRMNNCGISRASFAAGGEGNPSYDNAEVEMICVNDVAHLSEIT